MEWWQWLVSIVMSGATGLFGWLAGRRRDNAEVRKFDADADESVVEAALHLVRELREELTRARSETEALNATVQEMRHQITVLKGELSQVQHLYDSMKAERDELRARLEEHPKAPPDGTGRASCC